MSNVAITLYRDTDADGLPNGAAIATTTSDANGYYIFDGLTAGDYIVALDNANFAATNPLDGLLSSTGNGTDNQQDSDVDENGIDALNATYGLLSPTINLTLSSETTTEADLGPDGNGSNGESADNSELTVDFGLYEPLSLGNRVWFDSDNNGLLDVTESGIGGVVVNLYQDDGTGTFVQIATTTTDSNGYYIFDGLGEGNYYVEIPATNFHPAGVLINLNSSTGANNNDADNNDNGIDDPTPATNGIISNTTTLTRGTEPINDADLGPDGHGSNGEQNNNSDLSIDFGFFGGTMALGNRVWFDDGAGGGNARDGIRDATELGAAGVSVSLYQDSNADGTPDAAAIATTTTECPMAAPYICLLRKRLRHFCV
ncbi:MAG: SdrD B-like domain-containing protein [Anaerolineae bacterium]|nr:SdrD B-like domain-containing protein [Anaerolineae bacterium]